jgi:hypothetical protein
MQQKRNKENQERGAKGEELITSSLKSSKLWSHKFINAGFGTVFDKLVIPPGGGYGLEIKVRKDPTIGYNEKSITKNERKGLNAFVEKVGPGNAFIIGIWINEDIKRAFIIPWIDVRDAVCSGDRGSIKMQDFEELERKSSGWNLERFKNIKEVTHEK